MTNLVETVDHGYLVREKKDAAKLIAASYPGEVLFDEYTSALGRGTVLRSSLVQAAAIVGGGEHPNTRIRGFGSLGLQNEKATREIIYAFSNREKKLRVIAPLDGSNYGVVLNSDSCVEVPVPRILSRMVSLKPLAEIRGVVNQTDDKKVFDPVTSSIKSNGFAETIAGLLLVGLNAQSIKTMIGSLRSVRQGAEHLLEQIDNTNFEPVLTLLKHEIDTFRISDGFLSLDELVQRIKGNLETCGLKFESQLSTNETITVRGRPFMLLERVVGDDGKVKFANQFESSGYLVREPTMSYRFATDNPRPVSALRRVEVVDMAF